MDPKKGTQIATSSEILCFIDLLERKSIQQSEELVLNVIRCITNLTYYENNFNKVKIASSKFF
jgi:hypothetical protein